MPKKLSPIEAATEAESQYKNYQSEIRRAEQAGQFAGEYRQEGLDRAAQLETLGLAHHYATQDAFLDGSKAPTQDEVKSNVENRLQVSKNAIAHYSGKAAVHELEADILLNKASVFNQDYNDELQEWAIDQAQIEGVRIKVEHQGSAEQITVHIS